MTRAARLRRRRVLITEVTMERAMSTRGPSHDERGDRHRQRFCRHCPGVGSSWPAARGCCGSSLTGGFPAWGQFAVGIAGPAAGRADARRPVHAAAQRGRHPAALRRVPAARSRTPGLRATNPFYTRRKISLRARNLNGDRLKVNDKRGNPIEIAAVVVWHVEDTAKAAFDVDDYEMFVKVQSESAVRHLASSFAYDAEEKLGRRRASRRCSKAPTSSPAHW